MFSWAILACRFSDNYCQLLAGLQSSKGSVGLVAQGGSLTWVAIVAAFWLRVQLGFSTYTGLLHRA